MQTVVRGNTRTTRHVQLVPSCTKNYITKMIHGPYTVKFHFLPPSCSFQLSQVHLNVLSPFHPWPSLRSCAKWFPIGYNFDITIVCHSSYVAELSNPLGFNKFYDVFTFNYFLSFITCSDSPISIRFLYRAIYLSYYLVFKYS